MKRNMYCKDLEKIIYTSPQDFDNFKEQNEVVLHDEEGQEIEAEQPPQKLE